jgi:hypothetical protein
MSDIERLLDGISTGRVDPPEAEILAGLLKLAADAMERVSRLERLVSPPRTVVDNTNEPIEARIDELEQRLGVLKLRARGRPN